MKRFIKPNEDRGFRLSAQWFVAQQVQCDWHFDRVEKLKWRSNIKFLNLMFPPVPTLNFKISLSWRGSNYYFQLSFEFTTLQKLNLFRLTFIEDSLKFVDTITKLDKCRCKLLNFISKVVSTLRISLNTLKIKKIRWVLAPKVSLFNPRKKAKKIFFKKQKKKNTQICFCSPSLTHKTHKFHSSRSRTWKFQSFRSRRSWQSHSSSSLLVW